VRADESVVVGEDSIGIVNCASALAGISVNAKAPISRIARGACPG